MAKDISIKLNFASNGKAVIGDLTISAQQLKSAISSVKKGSDYSFKSLMGTMSAITVSINGVVSSLQSLSAPVKSFDTAMRSANTMAGKGKEDFAKLKDEIKELSKEVPVARDILANGLYQTISNGVPEDNWIEYLRTSARSAVGGMANLDEVVKVTSTVIKNYGLSWVMEERL